MRMDGLQGLFVFPASLVGLATSPIELLCSARTRSNRRNKDGRHFRDGRN